MGGVLRDLFLNRAKENPDFDFCLKKGAINFGRKLAKQIKAGFVVLDKEHGACRLVKRINNRPYTFDFTDFRGRDIKEDLLRRDFTINAMALELDKLFSKNAALSLRQKPALDSLSRPHKTAAFKPRMEADRDSAKKETPGGAPLIDPHGGRRDLNAKTIRIVDIRAFDDDPLRILRTFSFASLLDFKIDPATLRLARQKRNKLGGVSYERIRDELFKILDNPRAFDYLVQLDKLKILKVIFPELEKMRGVGQGPYHHLDVWQHSLETVRQLELLAVELKDNREIRIFLDETISGERKRLALLKLGAILHDIGKPAALRREGKKLKFHGHERIGCDMSQEILRRLKLSNDETSALAKIVLWHLRPGYLADNAELTPRAIFRFFRDAGGETISILLLSLADQRATKGPLTTKESRRRHEKVVFGLLKEYFRRKKEKKIPRLLNGDDLMQRFKLEPSPLIGKILSELEEAQAIGKIKHKKDAWQLAKKIVGGSS